MKTVHEKTKQNKTKTLLCVWAEKYSMVSKGIGSNHNWSIYNRRSNERWWLWNPPCPPPPNARTSRGVLLRPELEHIWCLTLVSGAIPVRTWRVRVPTSCLQSLPHQGPGGDVHRSPLNWDWVHFHLPHWPHWYDLLSFWTLESLSHCPSPLIWEKTSADAPSMKSVRCLLWILDLTQLCDLE